MDQVTLLGLDLYKEVFDKILNIAHEGTPEAEYLCMSIKEDDIRDVIATLYEMNEVSYCSHFQQPINEEHIKETKELIQRWQYNEAEKKRCNIYQLLKHLHCIRYQIQEDNMDVAGCWTKEYEYTLDWLVNVIDKIQYHIIISMPQWKEAK